MYAVMRVLKRLPIDFGQYEVRYTTKGKQIALASLPVHNGGEALDVGCRDGHWTKVLRERGYKVTAFDLEPTLPEALVLDANQPLPFATSSFHVVWCAEVIEHLGDPAKTIAEMLRVLRPGGTLVLTTPNSGFWLFRLLGVLGIPAWKLQNDDHLQFFHFGDFKKLMGPTADESGYFPYLGPKFVIRRFAGLLSPTIVVVYQKPS